MARVAVLLVTIPCILGLYNQVKIIVYLNIRMTVIFGVIISWRLCVVASPEIDDFIQ